MKKIFLYLIIGLFLCPSLVFAEDVTSTRSIKEFSKEQTELRVAADSIEAYKASLNEMSLKVIQRAAELAKAEARKTILKRDMVQATEEVFRRAPMTIAELMEKIKLLSIIDLAELSNQVKAYSKELLEKRKE